MEKQQVGRILIQFKRLGKERKAAAESYCDTSGCERRLLLTKLNGKLQVRRLVKLGPGLCQDVGGRGSFIFKGVGEKRKKWKRNNFWVMLIECVR